MRVGIEVTAEQRAAALHHEARVDGELAAMREQVRALEQKLKRVADEQLRATRTGDR